MNHFIPPWSGDPARYPAAALEQHSAHCRALRVPDDTTPADVRQLMQGLTEDEQIAVRQAGLDAVVKLQAMVDWHPEHDNDTETAREALRNPYYTHICLWGGRGGGKSHDIAEAIIELASTGTERVVCGREFQNSIDDSAKTLLEDKIKASRWANQWKVTHNELTNTVTGSTIIFIGVSRNPNSAKSMEGATIFWGEEASEFIQSSLDIILPTMTRTKRSRFFWSFNPQTKTTPIDKMFRQGERPERSYVRMVQCTDNVHFYSDTKMAGERRTAFTKQSLQKFRWIWCGAYNESPEGLVYQHWTTGRVSLPENAVPLYGIDWGWTDPFACLEVFVIEPDDPETERGTIYIRREVYGAKIPAKKLPGRIAEAMPLAKSHQIIADSAEPKSIDDFKDAGFYVTPARKGPGSIRAGISFIQGYDIVVSPDCPNVATELTLYRWKTDKTGTILRDPVDADNHAMDCLRYALEDYTPALADDGGVDYV